MAGSSYGTLFKLTTFGESHGTAIGGIIEGLPAHVELDLTLVQQELDRRKPGQSALTSPRKESDEVQILSGIFEGKTTGSPIGFMIPNSNAKSEDYLHMKDAFRPSHADFTYQQKYGHRDYRGGGRSSARETACRVVAGAMAKQVLSTIGIEFSTYVSQVGTIALNNKEFFALKEIEATPVRCPDLTVAQQMIDRIEEIKNLGDSIGGAVQCVVTGVPVGLGEPVFDKLNAELGKAILSINAVKGFEIGSGFTSLGMTGSEHNDVFLSNGQTKTNFSGGIQGGISNGMPIDFRVAFKPVATIMQDQVSVDQHGNEITIEGKGRHDACVLPRAVPIVEAMAAIVLLDLYLRHKAIHL
jgi:chorismate synthase